MEANEARRFVVPAFCRFVTAPGVFIFHLKTIDNGISNRSGMALMAFSWTCSSSCPAS